MPTIEAVGTAVPEHKVGQRDVMDIAESYLEEVAPDLLDYLPLMENAGIETRYLSEPFPWYLSNPGWGERADEFQKVGLALAEEATRGALAGAGVQKEGIDGVVLVTTTGLATPSLEARLVNRMGLREDLIRVPVWGLGCAGGVAGLARTADLARAHPDKRFLLVSLELCSLAFLSGDLSKRTLVAVALFGDGCAATLVAGDELDASGPRLSPSASHQWPDSEDVMGWDVRDEGLGVVFSPRIPELVENELGPVVQRFLKGANGGSAPDRYLFHPGGAKVLDAYEKGLSLDDQALDASRRVLREYGNMSSPTALFTLAHSLEDRPLDEGETGLMAALGPGFAAELALVQG